MVVLASLIFLSQGTWFQLVLLLGLWRYWVCVKLPWWDLSLCHSVTVCSILGIHCVVKELVTRLCPTLCNPMDCSPPGSSVYGKNSLGKNTGVGSHPLLQGIFPTQGSILGLLCCRQIQAWGTLHACKQPVSHPPILCTVETVLWPMLLEGLDFH